MFVSICGPCEMGDHAKHQPIITPAPEGGVGGVSCGCPGGCVYVEPEWITEFKEWRQEVQRNRDAK